MIKGALGVSDLLRPIGALKGKGLFFSLQETENSLFEEEQATRSWKVRASTLSQPEELASGTLNRTTVYMITQEGE